MVCVTVAGVCTVPELCKRRREGSACVSSQRVVRLCTVTAGVFTGLLSLLGSPAVAHKPPFPKSDPTKGERQGARRAGVCAAEPQERQ